MFTEQPDEDIHTTQPTGDLPLPSVPVKLKFEGKLNEVNAETLGYSLVNITSIIQEVNAESGGGQTLEIRVRATEPGSFLVHLSLEAAMLPILGLVGSEGVLKVVMGIVETTTALFKLRKALKGEPPQNIVRKDDEFNITAGDGSTLKIERKTFNLYFGNPKVNEALAKTFKALDRDESIDGFEITDAEEKPLFEANREDFAGMALTTSVPRPDTQDTTESVNVHIVKPSFDPKLKWEVLYKGNRTSVWMRDKEFQARIERGERFAKGDVLAVRMRIHQKWDKSLGAYVNKTFEIVHVEAHLPRPEEGNLFRDLSSFQIGEPKSRLALPGGSPSEDDPESKPKGRKIVFDDV